MDLANIKPIEIDVEDHKALIAENNELMAIQRMLDMFTQNCQARLAQHQAKARTAWERIAKKHNIDLNNVAWDIDQQRPLIFPVQVKLK